MAHGRSDDLRIVVSVLERRHRALGNRERRIGNGKARIDLLAAANAQAIGAGAVRGVEGEVARLQGVHRMAVLGAGERKGIEFLLRRFVRPDHLEKHAPIGDFRRKLNCLGNAAGRFLVQCHAVDHDLDGMAQLLVEHNFIVVKAAYFAIDAGAGETLAAQVGKQLREFAFPVAHHRRHHQRAHAVMLGDNLVGDLVGRLLLDDTTAFRTMRRSHAGEQKAQVIVDFRRRSHRGTGVAARRFLVDRDRRRQAVDAIEVGLVHLTQELAGVAGKAFDIAALAFGKNRVESERALSRTRKARNDDKLVAGYRHIDVLEVMLARAFDDNGILSHSLPP